MSIIVIAEHDNAELKPATLNAIGAASFLQDSDVQVLVAGYQCQAVAQQAANVAGVSKVLLADAQAYQHRLAENVAPLIVKLAANVQHVLAPATTFAKDCMP